MNVMAKLKGKLGLGRRPGAKVLLLAQFRIPVILSCVKPIVLPSSSQKDLLHEADLRS